MGPLSEHFRSSEILAELREAELAGKFARRQALGRPQANPRRPSLMRALASRLLGQRPAPAPAIEGECDPALDTARPARA